MHQHHHVPHELFIIPGAVAPRSQRTGTVGSQWYRSGITHPPAYHSRTLPAVTPSSPRRIHQPISPPPAPSHAPHRADWALGSSNTLPSGPAVPLTQQGAVSYHYWLAEAEPEAAEAYESAADVPLVMWMNGGPGASSLGYGYFSELGPFCQ